MKFIHVSFLLLLSSLFSLTAEANGSISVDITKEYAKFYFPIYEERSYEWHKKSTQGNSLEYAFAINIGTLQAGYYLYKYPGAEQKTGSLSKLLGSGQRSVWESDSGSQKTSYRHSLDFFYSKPYLVISITNPETLKLLSQFNEVSFLMKGFRSYETKLNITLPGLE